MSDQSANFETLKHIELVMQYLATMQFEIQRRMFSHDRSKLESPEREMFEKFTSSLSGLTYGSDEYNQCLEEMKKSALGHHYEHNLHHPEHFPNGVDDMNLIDVLEMLCDWKAAGQRHSDGSIHKSLIINAERFKISPQLVKILENTIPLLYSMYGHKTQKYFHDYWHCFGCGPSGLEGNYCGRCGEKKYDYTEDGEIIVN